MGLAIKLFELHYTSRDAGKRGAKRRIACVTAPISKDLPVLRIGPSASEAAYFYKEFGSQEFHKMYRVTCNDRELVKHLVQPELVDMFLEDPGLRLEIAEGLILLSRNGGIRPQMILPLAQRITKVHNLLKNYELPKIDPARPMRQVDTFSTVAYQNFDPQAS